LEERKLRLIKLIEHWAEHNDEHGHRYLEAAAEAENIGLEKIANELRAAHKNTTQVSRHLKNALI